MITIRKYAVNPRAVRNDFVEFQMPQAADILAVQNQDEEICFWARVDTAMPNKEVRRIYIVGTGHEMMQSARGRYIGTAQFLDGRLVLHAFE